MGGCVIQTSIVVDGEEKIVRALNVDGNVLVNLTPHEVVVKDYKIPPSGIVARVESDEKLENSIADIPVRKVVYTNIKGLPEPKPDHYFIVSTVVLMILKLICNYKWRGFDYRGKVVSPDTRNPIRNEKGQIVGVSGFQIL